jgi:N-formylglutamate amidohydrolase
LSHSPNRFYRLQDKLPSQLALGCLIFFILALSGSARSEEFTLTQGDIPIILVNPHGGSEDLPDGLPRRKEESSDPRFSASKDLVTAELTRQLWETFPAQSRPSVLFANIHRKYVDYNRPEEHAAPEGPGRQAHARFHRALSDEITRVKGVFGWALLIDIHGQSSQDIDVIVGTKQGQTVTPWSEERLWSPTGILAELQRTGFSTAPESPQSFFKYGGGYIVAHYGQDKRVEAWQLEHGKKLRFDKERNNVYTTILGRMLLDAQAHAPEF